MSGVYIKGIEMPVTCCHCPRMGYDPDIEWNDGWRDAHGAYICVLTHELIDNTKREEHCPLVTVPPHGRLGDLDKQDAQIEALIERHLHGYTKSTWDFVCELRDILKRNRTIIPAEPSEEQREYEAQVEAAQYCEMHEPSYDPETGAL